MRRVSIIVPAFNQGRYLRQAVESALGQTHANVEVVIVDDGSTDSTFEVCRELSVRPNVVVIRQENRGVGAARNRGAAAAIGDYLCFLDADDFYHQDKVALQARVLDRSHDLEWVYCDIVPLDESGAEELGGYSVAGARRQLTGDILESLLVGGFFPPHTVMMRRRAFEELGGFDPALGGNADLDLWLRMAASGRRVEFVNQRLAYYRTHPGSMSRDLSHMRSTRVAALTKLARRYPERAGVAISTLQDLHEDLHRGNQWLNEQLGRIADTVTSQAMSSAAVTSLVQDAAAGRRMTDTESHVAIWDVTINGLLDRALVLHPPAAVTFTVPTGGAMRLTGSVALHPDLWEHPESGGCQFQITADDHVRWIGLIDPCSRADDRRWIDFALDIPARASGVHTIQLETSGIGGNDYRWALWRGLDCVLAPAVAMPQVA